MAKDQTSHYYVKFEAYAELDGKEVDIFKFELTYALDQIPSITLYPTVGREPLSNKEAEAVTAFLKASAFTPLKVFVKADTDLDNASEEDGFPHGEGTMVFDGYVIDVGYSTTRTPAGGSASLIVQGQGWLLGLAGSDVQTNLNSVKGPGGFAEIANSDGSMPGLFDLTSIVYADVEGAKSDLWLEFIKPLFDAIVQTPSVWGGDSNASAEEALARMDSGPFGAGDAPNTLAFSLSGGAPPEFVSQTIATAIAYDIFKNWQRSNLWSALQSLARLFEFHIVPLIDTASCAPVYGPLQCSEVWREITVDDYFALSIASRTPAKVTKLVLVGNTISSAFSPSPRVSAILGIYSAESAFAGDAKGLTVAEPAPGWLEAEVPIGERTRESVGGSNLLIPDAVNPDANVTEPDEDYQENYSNYITSDMGDRLAKTRLQQMFLADRRGMLEGRFRLDIAPGSMVSIEVVDDKFGQQSEQPQKLVAMVEKVVIVLDSGASGTGSASTQLHLACVRTSAEDDGSVLTSSEHPIYKQAYKGAKLWAD